MEFTYNENGFQKKIYTPIEVISFNYRLLCTNFWNEQEQGGEFMYQVILKFISYCFANDYTRGCEIVELNKRKLHATINSELNRYFLSRYNSIRRGIA